MKYLLLDGTVTENPIDYYNQYFALTLQTDPGSTIEDVLYGVGIKRFIDAPTPKLYDVKRRCINSFEPNGWQINDVNITGEGDIAIDAQPPLL